GIRALHVTGVQTCALPISTKAAWISRQSPSIRSRAQRSTVVQQISFSAIRLIRRPFRYLSCPPPAPDGRSIPTIRRFIGVSPERSDERRVGKVNSLSRTGE